MGLVTRGIVFAGITTTNAALFVFYSRGVLTVTEFATSFSDGPATPAINMIPQAVVVAMLMLQVGVTAYFLAGFGQQRNVSEVAP